MESTRRRPPRTWRENPAAAKSRRNPKAPHFLAAKHRRVRLQLAAASPRGPLRRRRRSDSRRRPRTRAAAGRPRGRRRGDGGSRGAADAQGADAAWRGLSDHVACGIDGPGAGGPGAAGARFGEDRWKALAPHLPGQAHRPGPRTDFLQYLQQRLCPRGHIRGSVGAAAGGAAHASRASPAPLADDRPAARLPAASRPLQLTLGPCSPRGPRRIRA